MMTLDEKVLAEAKKLRERSIDAQFEAERTALSYQHAIRKLHAAGGSLREIAEALGMSHQRVHQIVDPDSGKQGLKESSGRKTQRTRRCEFCSRFQADVRKLIAGPDVHICDDCIDLARRAIDTRVPESNEVTVIKPAGPDDRTSCNFCGKKSKQVQLVVGPAYEPKTPAYPAGDVVAICNECLDLCADILVEEGDRPKK